MGILESSHKTFVFVIPIYAYAITQADNPQSYITSCKLVMWGLVATFLLQFEHLCFDLRRILSCIGKTRSNVYMFFFCCFVCFPEKVALYTISIGMNSMKVYGNNSQFKNFLLLKLLRS